ncbi:MAG: hypothetical protein IPJ25_07210 [Rhodocyclaceae bacterium]|nr:hypothetical protein [Rhodocyclaceae bacterium]
MLSLALFLINAVRSLSGRKALAAASTYVVIALGMLLTAWLLPDNLAAEMDKSNLMAFERQQEFDAGADWARDRRPTKASQCKGSLQFIKGCRSYFIQYLAKPKPAGQQRYEGMTTAECDEEVNANYDALKQEYLENGNRDGAAVLQSDRSRELRDCENYDNFADNIFMPKAYDRLQKAISVLKRGDSIKEAEKSGIAVDFVAMSSIRDQPYKSAYLNLSIEYNNLLLSNEKSTMGR